MTTEIFKKATLLFGALATAFSMSGCQNMPKTGEGGSPATASLSAPTPILTPSELKLREDESRFDSTVFGGVVTGAMIGAIGAGLIAALSGANKKQTQKAVLLGAIGGGLVGGVDGYATAKKEQAGNNEVAAIRSAAADLRTDNARLQQVIDTSDKVLRDGAVRLATLKSDVATGKVTQKQAQDARAREEENIAVLSKALAKAKETRTQYSQAGQRMAQPAARSDLDAEIARTDGQIAQLERNVSQYNLALTASKA